MGLVYLLRNMPVDFISQNLRVPLSKTKTHPVFFRNDEGKNIKAGFKLEQSKTYFGLEDYGKNKILNIEVNNKGTNNETYNRFAAISQIEALFANLIDQKDYMNMGLRQLMKGREFYSSIRTDDKTALPILRTKAVPGFTANYDDGNIAADYIKQKGAFTVILSSVWFNDTHYGLNWITRSLVLD